MKVELLERVGEGFTLELSDPDISNIPFIFENRCRGLIIRLQQAGQKQVLLIILLFFTSLGTQR